MKAKPLKNPLLHYGLLFFIYGSAVVTLLTHTLFHSVHAHTEHDEHAVMSTVEACPASAPHHYVLTFTGSQLDPVQMSADRCDEIEFYNASQEKVSPAFGEHEHHDTYSGFKPTVLQSGQRLSVRLTETGTFAVHDHYHDEHRGTVTVRE